MDTLNLKFTVLTPAKKWISFCPRQTTVGLLLMMLTFLGLSGKASGQASNADFDRLKIGDGNWHFTGVDYCGESNMLVACTKEAAPLKITDWESGKITAEYPAGNWPTGSKVSFSAKGKYILLQQQGYNIPAINKPTSISFEIVEAATGRQVKLFDKVQDVVISADEKTALSLCDGEVVSWNLPDASRSSSFKVGGAANAIELSPDGKTIVVSHSITKEDLKGDKTFDKQKKAVSFAVKYKQRISFYDARSQERISTIGELYDIIYNFRFSPDGKWLFVLQSPDLNAQTTKKGITYINLVNTESREPVRMGFTSQSITRPELKFSNSGKMFAINSRGSRFQEILLYDLEEGSLLKRFELGYRLFEKSEGEKFTNDSRPSYVFLPGDGAILVAMGNRLIKWNLELNQ
jgi:hypothetical protein